MTPRHGREPMTTAHAERSLPPHPLVLEIDTWPWLAGLGAPAGGLADVPASVWDAVAARGYDAVWLMGVWSRSPAGVALALANGELMAGFRAALPDLGVEDVVGSPYCVRDYV